MAQSVKFILVSLIILSYFNSHADGGVASVIHLIKKTADSSYSYYTADLNYGKGLRTRLEGYINRNDIKSISFAETIYSIFIENYNGFIYLNEMGFERYWSKDFPAHQVDGYENLYFYRPNTSSSSPILTPTISKITSESVFLRYDTLSLSHHTINNFTTDPYNNQLYYLSYNTINKTQNIGIYDVGNNSMIKVISFDHPVALEHIKIIAGGIIAYTNTPEKTYLFEAINTTIENYKLTIVPTMIERVLGEKFHINLWGENPQYLYLVEPNGKTHIYDPTSRKISNTYNLDSKIINIGEYGLSEWWSHTPSYIYEKGDSLKISLSFPDLEKESYYLGHSDSTFAISGSEIFASLDDLNKSNLNQQLIYPNPTQDLIHLHQPFKHVKIISAKGVVMMNKTLKNNRLDVSHLKSGIYILQLETDTGIETYRFTKK